MLSKFVTSFALKQQVARGFRYAQPQMVFVSQRGFLDRLGLEGQVTELTVDGRGGEVSLWQEKAKQ